MDTNSEVTCACVYAHTLYVCMHAHVCVYTRTCICVCVWVRAPGNHNRVWDWRRLYFPAWEEPGTFNANGNILAGKVVNYFPCPLCNKGTQKPRVWWWSFYYPFQSGVLSERSPRRTYVIISIFELVLEANLSTPAADPVSRWGRNSPSRPAALRQARWELKPLHQEDFIELLVPSLWILPLTHWRKTQTWPFSFSRGPPTKTSPS